MRHRLVLEEAQRAPDGGGDAGVNWQPIATLWGGIRAVNGNETVIAEQVSGRITHEIVLRHRSGIAPAMRLRLAERIFEILAVRSVDGRGRVLLCLCREEML
ncbi:MAG: phage head closure protein [Hyphomicrobiaceae bacterium]